MAKSEVRKIIEKLKTKELSIFNVPKEYEKNIQIVTFERKSGLRITGRRGFDIISNSFFVEEELIHIGGKGEERRKNIILSFDNFDSYYNFLNGDIYNNACYAFCPLLYGPAISQKIDLEKLMARDALIEETIDDYSLSLSDKEKELYEKGNYVHKSCQQWCKKFNRCTSYIELQRLAENYKRAKIAPIVDVRFFFFQYIFADTKNKDRFSIIMDYVSSCDTPNILNELCSIYNSDDVLQSFHCSWGEKATRYKYTGKLKEYIKCLKNGEIVFQSNAYFSKETHYYCEEIQGYAKWNKYVPITKIYRYFETFDEFITYRNGDLTHCDLSEAIECNTDFSDYKIDETTTLPIHANKEITYSIKKYYLEKKFYVIQQWHNTWGAVIKQYEHSFDYFFDFVAFLKGNLSGANLLFCDGLRFLEQWNTINFANARMKSSLCEKFGLKYDTQEINSDLIKSFDCVKQNEKESSLALETSRDLIKEGIKKDLLDFEIEFNIKCQKIHYISDLHLLHRIQNEGCRSKDDIIYVIQKIVNTIAEDTGRLLGARLLLISGDVSSDFSIFQLFIEILSKTLSKYTTVVFTLGNHELWSFPEVQIDQIVAKYRDVLDKHGMYLLHNDLLYKKEYSVLDNSEPGIHLIKYADLCQMNEKQIANCLRRARYVILGGLGFSGHNMEFNADNGIYQRTIDRKTEIKESKIFEDLYNRLHPILSNKNTIILTHTPKIDWSSKPEPDKNYVYVSGHTHKNFFHDDGEYRIYSDNQIGYHNDNPHLKTFLIDIDYDCFSDYDDGIYEITQEEYKDFYRGKNIQMTFGREVNVLYMLKRNKYYCFIHKSKSGSLTILNGGAMKTLEKRDIQYYYDNMDDMVSKIEQPLNKFTSFQRNIADAVKKIGGIGIIHGSIIDIDFLNHIYVNPTDFSITGYWARDIINKIVFPSIPTLLESKCPKLFDNYKKMLEEDSKNPLALKSQTNTEISPQVYLDTDIYKASREIKKMQKLNSNILCTWYEDSPNKESQIKLIKN